MTTMVGSVVNRSVSPSSSGRASPALHVARKSREDNLLKTNKPLKRYAAAIDRVLSSWENSPEEWADYIAFLGRLLKAIQSQPNECPFLPHCAQVASKLSQCLNPALPSGVHQKALEIYTCIFASFERDFLAAHLSELLPGLSGVLAFASLAVRPVIYDIYETHLLQFSTSDLRPALKSLILSLLPAIEDESSEDFDRAFDILRKLQDVFASPSSAPTGQAHDRSGGFFWQCFFLCIITGISRRQGALHYLVRKLPSTIDPKAQGLPSGAEAIITPEPGLLIRAFIAGLDDLQSLVQRGFLDLLIARLPLHSPVLESRVAALDIDSLMKATIRILLRRDMSLNRRIWSWFLGPTPSGDNVEDGQPLSPAARDNEVYPAKLEYFVKYGRQGLERCLLSMLHDPNNKAIDIVKFFRTCLSLMDRWEIGGSIVPQIFFPAMQTAYAFSQDSSPTEAAEITRSASLFFDGVEGRLIWSHFIQLLRGSIRNEQDSSQHLQILGWICRSFNVRDEEMLSIHVPCVILYVLALLNLHTSSLNTRTIFTMMSDLAAQLLDVLATSPKIMAQTASDTLVTRTFTSMEACQIVEQYYDVGQPDARITEQLLQPSTFADLISKDMTRLLMHALAERSRVRLGSAISLITNIQKSLSIPFRLSSELITEINSILATQIENRQAIEFAIVASIIDLLTICKEYDGQFLHKTKQLGPLLISALWTFLSASLPAHHVEAVQSIWKLEEHVLAVDVVKLSLLTLLRASTLSAGPSDSDAAESVRRFAILWGHTISGSFASGRIDPTSASSAARMQNHLRTLHEPLLLVLDALKDRSDDAFEPTKSWLNSLPSLPSIVDILLQQLKELDTSRLTDCADPFIAERDALQSLNEKGYLLAHIGALLTHVTHGTWHSLCRSDAYPEGTNAVSLIIKVANELMTHPHGVARLKREAFFILESILSMPFSEMLNYDDATTVLLKQLILSLDSDNWSMSQQLLQLAGMSLKLRSIKSAAEAASVESLPKESLSLRRGPGEIPSSVVVNPIRTEIDKGLLICLQKGFSSQHSQREMDRWLSFLAEALSTFGESLHVNLIPLTSCFCAELDKAFTTLKSFGVCEKPIVSFLPDLTIVGLFEAIEMTLARAHDSLREEASPEQSSRMGSNATGFLSTITPGVFKSESIVANKNLQTNSRLTVILALQDAVRIALRIWSWAYKNFEPQNTASVNTATISHSALKVRNKTRQILEHIFAAESLEAMEVVMLAWTQSSASPDVDPAMTLLHTMKGMKPQFVIESIVDALCSRINRSATILRQVSSQTIDIPPIDIIAFLIAYVKTTEDDVVEEIWATCMAILREILSNPLPYRQTLPVMLRFVLILAQKLNNTNYGEQRKMRRELGDIFQRLLTATFTTMSASQLQEAVGSDSEQATIKSDRGVYNPGLLATLVHIAANLETILETADRTTTTVNNISSQVISTIMRAKAFPNNVSLDALLLLVELSNRSPQAKSWKKEVSDAFYDARFFASRQSLVEPGWFPILNQWALRDRERMSDLLSRITAPSSAGIMFGVGANVARLEADRKTQLNLRRVCTLLLASDEDTYVALMGDFQLKLVELFDATHASSPSSVVKADLFMLIRALLLSVGTGHLTGLWPAINENLRAAFTCLESRDGQQAAFNNLALVQACKLLDFLTMVSPDEFQLHEWLYITDTIDAVYHPPNWTPTALSDRIAESLGTGDGEDASTFVSAVALAVNGPGRRKPLFQDISIDKEDLMAMSQEECARQVLRPFLSQLSILAYEGVYSMEQPDMDACRRSLLDDLFDVATMIE